MGLPSSVAVDLSVERSQEALSENGPRAAVLFQDLYFTVCQQLAI